MSHFPNAFHKHFLLAYDGSPLAIDLATTGGSNDLDAGQVGLFDAKDWTIITAAPSAGTIQPFVIAQGSRHANDKIGQFHGGYQESHKSKIINPKYVNRFWKSTAVTAQNQVIAIGWDTLTSSSNEDTFAFKCGNTYRLRLDIKGSAALRFLTHNLYHTIDAFTGCCADDCTSGCTNDPVDPTIVFLAWSDYIKQDPILSKFISPKVYMKNSAVSPVVSKTQVYSEYDIEVAGSGTAYTAYTDEDEIAGVIAGMTLEVIYEDTSFADCTFTVTDHYELEPTQIYASVVDETGNPCATKPTGNSSTEEMVTELTAPRQASGVAETVLRKLILSQRYEQEQFHDSLRVEHLRMREIEGNTAMNSVDRDFLYDQVCLLHSVPRPGNPSSTMDSDQYLLVFHVPTGVSTTAFTNLIGGILTSAGNTTTLETL